MEPGTPNESDRAVSLVERGLLVLVVIVGVVLAAIWATRWGAWRDDEMTVTHQPTGDYTNKLDPNTASWQSLARLPGIGERRAKDIVAYREAFAGRGPAFTGPGDLAAVKGIGPKIVERIEPLLAFPAPASAPEF